MSKLRQRMIEDMKIRNYSPGTINVYVDRVAKFALYFNQSPDKLSIEHIREFQRYLVEDKRNPPLRLANTSWRHPCVQETFTPQLIVFCQRTNLHQKISLYSCGACHSGHTQRFQHGHRLAFLEALSRLQNQKNTTLLIPVPVKRRSVILLT